MLNKLAIDNESNISVKCAYVMPNLPVAEARVPEKFDIERWAHLKDVDLQYLPDRSIGILIGCDVREVHTVLEPRVGVGSQPYTAKSILGWSVRGPASTNYTAFRHINCVSVKEDSIGESTNNVLDKFDIIARFRSVRTHAKPHCW